MYKTEKQSKEKGNMKTYQGIPHPSSDPTEYSPASWSPHQPSYHAILSPWTRRRFSGRGLLRLGLCRMLRGVLGRTFSFVSICVQMLYWWDLCIMFMVMVVLTVTIYQVSKKPIKHQPRSKKIQQKDLEHDTSKGKEKSPRTYAARSIHRHCVQNWIEMRGRWTFASAILSLSVFESNCFEVDVDSAMMNIGLMSMRLVRLIGSMRGVVWWSVCGWSVSDDGVV